MTRPPNLERLAQIYHAIQKQPGKRPGSLARLLGLHRSEVLRALPALESRGWLLSEDEHGRLWPFQKES